MKNRNRAAGGYVVRMLTALLAFLWVGNIGFAEESVRDYLDRLSVEKMSDLLLVQSTLRPNGDWVQVSSKSIDVGPNDGTILVGMLLCSGEDSGATFFIDDLESSVGEIANGGAESGPWREPVTSRGVFGGSGRSLDMAQSGVASISCATEGGLRLEGSHRPLSGPQGRVTKPLSSGAVTTLSGLEKTGQTIELSAWVYIPKGLYTIIADTPHNHSHDTPLYFLVDVDGDGQFDIPKEIFGAFQLSDLRRYAKSLARKVLRYRDSLESGRADEKHRAEQMAAYLFMAALEHGEAQQLITRQLGRRKSEKLDDEEVVDLLLARAALNERLGESLAALEDYYELRSLGRKKDANRKISLNVQFHPQAVYEYAEAHPEIYGETSFVVPFRRTLTKGDPRASGQVETQTPAFANEADAKAVLRIIYRLDFATARGDPALTQPKDFSSQPPSWQKAKREEAALTAKEPSPELPSWQTVIVGWAEERLRSLGVEESKIQAFKAYKLGQPGDSISLSDLGL